MIIERRHVQRFYRLRDALMKHFAAFTQNRVVGDLLCESVLESVFDVADSRLLVDEFGELQIVQQTVKVILRFGDNIPQEPKRKFPSDRCEHLYQFLTICRQTLNASVETPLPLTRSLDL